MRIIRRNRTIHNYRYELKEPTARIDLFEVCAKVNKYLQTAQLTQYCAIPGEREQIFVYEIQHQTLKIRYALLNWIITVNQKGQTKIKACLAVSSTFDLMRFGSLVDKVHSIKWSLDEIDNGVFLVLYRDIDTLCQIIIKAEERQ